MDVVIIGRIGYDLYAREQGVELARVETFSRYLGGSSANMAVGLTRLGVHCTMLSCLGDDALSDYLISYLGSEGVETGQIQRKAGWLPSFCLTEISPPDHFPQVFYRDRPADTQFEIDETSHRRLIRDSALLVSNGTSLCDSPSRESTLRALEWAHEAGVCTALDVDYRAMSWHSPQEAALYIRLVLPWIRILIANPEELCLVAEESNLEAAIHRVRDLGVPILIAKLGARGVRAFSDEQDLEISPFPVQVTSTIGAGDGFAAGFFSAWLEQRPLADALRWGNAAAALVVTKPMCSEAMPSREELERLLAEHPEVVCVSVKMG